MTTDHRPAIIAPRDGKARTGPSGKTRVNLTFRERPPAPPSRFRLVLPVVFIAVAVVLLMQSKWTDRNKDKFVDPFVSRFLKQALTTQYIPVLCPHCSGRGVVQDPEDPAREYPCPVCFGVGTHYVRIAGDFKVICPACQGMGRIAGTGLTEAVFCERCGGRGMLKGVALEGTGGEPAHILQIECDECTGNGFIRDDKGRSDVCPVCFGLGYHWTRKFGPNDQLCPACGGVGRVRDADGTAHWCSRCGGSGLVLSPPPDTAAGP